MADTLHIVLMSDEGLFIDASINFTRLPEGVYGDQVADGTNQTVELIQPFTKDFKAFWTIVENIRARTYGANERDFLRVAASAWNNYPPGGEPQDLFIGGIKGQIQVLRTSPDVAVKLKASVLALGD